MIHKGSLKKKLRKLLINYLRKKSRGGKLEIDKKEFKKNTFYEFSKSQSDTIEWVFSVGLGDTYSLRFRYLNNTGDTIPMHLKIVDMNDIVVRDDIIYFSPRKNQWRSQRTTTGTSVNAGKYNVLLYPAGNPGLGIDAMDVQ